MILANSRTLISSTSLARISMIHCLLAAHLGPAPFQVTIVFSVHCAAEPGEFTHAFVYGFRLLFGRCGSGPVDERWLGCIAWQQSTHFAATIDRRWTHLDTRIVHSNITAKKSVRKCSAAKESRRNRNSPRDAGHTAGRFHDEHEHEHLRVNHNNHDIEQRWHANRRIDYDEFVERTIVAIQSEFGYFGWFNGFWFGQPQRTRQRFDAHPRRFSAIQIWPCTDQSIARTES